MANKDIKTLVLPNFKYGLDTRRDALSSLPGTLAIALDGHINAGAQFVKRKAFVRDTTAFPSYTRGLEDTDTGLVTFGGIPLELEILSRSRTSNVANLKLDTAYNHTQFIAIGDSVIVAGVTGDTAYNGTYVVTSVNPISVSYANTGPDEVSTTSAGTLVWSNTTKLPTGVSYQVLEAPQGITGAVTAVLGSIPFSCNYLGKAFAIARFSSGTFCYYDGELVQQSRAGQVLRIETGDETVSDLSRDLAFQINDLANRYPSSTEWRAIANKNALLKTDQTGFAAAGSTLIMSPPGIHFNPTLEKDSIAGLFGARLIDQDFEGSGSVAAQASFSISGSSGTVAVSAPQNDDGSGTADLTGGAISFITDLTTTATAIVTAINANTYLTGYTAVSSGANITVTAPLDFGVFTYNLTVVGTGTMTSSILVVPIVVPFTVKMKFSTVVVTSFGQSTSTVWYAGNEALPIGIPIVAGVPVGVTYTWKMLDNPEGSNVVCDTKLDDARTSPFIYFHQNSQLVSVTQGQVGDTNNRFHPKNNTISGTFTTKWRCTASVGGAGGNADQVVDFTMTWKR